MTSSTLEHCFQALDALSEEFQIEQIERPGFAGIFSCMHAKSGLEAILSLHDLTLGPALGGVRCYPYSSQNEALSDVMNLSRAMTHKAAASGLPIGGGKSVLCAESSKLSSTALRAFGRFIDAFSGQYIAAKDVGIGISELQEIRKATEYVAGWSRDIGGPSKFTAWGVVAGIEVSLEQVFGSSSCKGKTIAIQGLGGVGMALAEFLFWKGAQLIVSDTDPQKARFCAERFSAQVVSKDALLFVPCDVLSPCALGGVLFEENIGSVRAKIVAGGANNILASPQVADEMDKRGILYAPDYIINAGGLIRLVTEKLAGVNDPLQGKCRVEEIASTLRSIYDVARVQKISTMAAADLLVAERLRQGRASNAH